MDQFFNKADEDKLGRETNENEHVENSVSSGTRKGSEVHSTDLQDRAKMLKFWSEKYKVSVYQKREDETLLLMCLRKHKSDACIMHLIEIECDANATDKYGESPLHSAICRSSLKVATELIKRGANINAQDIFGDTPLQLAVFNSYEAMCMLLYYGADVDVRCFEDMLSPLGIGILYGKFGNSILTLMDYYVDEDLYVDIKVLNYNYSYPLKRYLLFASRLFKLAWTYSDHNSLTDFRRPFLASYLWDCNFPTNEWFECLQFILQSDNIVDYIEDFNDRHRYSFVRELLLVFCVKQIEINKRMSTIFMVLSLGTRFTCDALDAVFEFYGFGPELEAFIYAGDLHAIYNSYFFNFALLPFILAFSNDFSTKTIVSLLKNQIIQKHNYCHNAKNALRFFSFNSNAKAELLGTWCECTPNKCLIKKAINKVPEVPSLLELSRNRIYLSIRNSYKVEKPYHFHDVVKNLLLPQKLKDVIIFKTPIY